VAPDLTRDHAVIGTPDYMSPEQAKSSRDVDPRADLYSLGCALYFLLTGRVPFPYASPLQKILAHQNEPPPPVQALRPEVPAPVAGIIARLMAKRPDDRYQTAAALAEALALHAKYPPGTRPIEIVLVGAPGEGKPNSSTATSQATATSSPLAPVSSLELPTTNRFPTGQEEPLAVVAPSDHTPPPRGLKSAPEERGRSTSVHSGEPSEESTETESLSEHQPPALGSDLRSIRRLSWLFLAVTLLLVVANLVLMFWLISRL
jgi:serine/threonine-protein kinase